MITAAAIISKMRPSHSAVSAMRRTGMPSVWMARGVCGGPFGAIHTVIQPISSISAMTA